MDEVPNDISELCKSVQAVQLPLNLQEPQALGVLDSIPSTILGLIERPLHTIYNRKPLHFVSHPALDGPSVAAELQHAFGFALKLEKKWSIQRRV